MKVYIHTDIEGVAGWVFYAEKGASVWNLEHARRMNRLLTAEVNSAALAAFDAGATEVYINDNHMEGYNIYFEELDPRCKIIHGRAGYFPHWIPLLDESFEAAICVGAHAMAGTPAAICPHTMWHMTLGDGSHIKLSEGTMFAALAGAKGVPVVAMSGDDKIAAEFHEKVPGCETAVVKYGLAAQNAVSLMPRMACELIRGKVSAGMAGRRGIAPLRLKGPFKLNISCRDPQKRELPSDALGDDLWTMLMEVSKGAFGGHYGDQSIDDYSWRYPRDVYNK